MAEEGSAAMTQNDAELKKSIKSGMGLVVFAVVMTVIALGSIGFIIYNKVTEEKRIDDAVSERCVTPASSIEGPTISGDSSSVEISDATNCVNSGDGASSDSDYIYISEWGLKIKKPADYYVWYRFEPDTGSEVKGKLSLSASRKDAQAWANYGNFDGGGQIVSIYRMDHENTQVASAPKFIGKIGDYYYYERTPQACYSDDCEGELAAFNALDAVLSDINNYYAF